MCRVNSEPYRNHIHFVHKIFISNINIEYKRIKTSKNKFF